MDDWPRDIVVEQLTSSLQLNKYVLLSVCRCIKTFITEVYKKREIFNIESKVQINPAL